MPIYYKAITIIAILIIALTITIITSKITIIIHNDGTTPNTPSPHPNLWSGPLPPNHPHVLHAHFLSLARAVARAVEATQDASSRALGGRHKLDRLWGLTAIQGLHIYIQ